MAIAKQKKPRRKPEDMENLQSEVASFASSIGLASSAAPAFGFDDSDFRKTGPMKPLKSAVTEMNSETPRSKGQREKAPKPPKAHVSRPNPLENINPYGVGDVVAGKVPSGKGGTNPSKLPLMRASSPLGRWYDELDELENKVFGAGRQGNTPAIGLEDLKHLVKEKKLVAERLMTQYVEDYEARTRNHGDWRLVWMAAKSGTTNDKVTALATLVGDNPLANMKSLDILLGLVDAKVGKRYAFKGFDHLAELFKTRLLPDRKLKCLLQRPIDSLPESGDGFSLLFFWYWEECLKQRYERFVIALEEASKDMLPTLKDLAMKLMYGLLMSKMEQERRLLYALVNKLGDPLRKTASTAGYFLSCLLSEHPNMKLVVIEEVDSFVFRPHVGLRAKYHAVNFLSQIVLSKRGDGPKVAKRLVDIYFAIFKVLISSGHNNTKDDQHDKNLKKNNKSKEKRNNKKLSSKVFKDKGKDSLDSFVEMDSRLLSVLLTGVNRAFPFVSSDEADDVIDVQTPILFRLVHSNNFNVGIQALTLLYQISSKNQILSDRFYRALYAKLLVPTALNSSKHEMFLALLFKAMKSDLNVKRVSAFSKRLLQISLQQPPQYACGCLCLISEVLKARPPVWTMMLQIESLDEDLEHFKDITEDTDKIDDAPSDVLIKKADSELGVKEIGCVEERSLSVGDKPRTCMLKEEHSSGDVTKDRLCSSRDGWASSCARSMTYDPRHREPVHCNAETASWWELTVLASHVHPSVAAMAQTLLSGVNIIYNGDPLNDLSLVSFLDKFMEKKPKLNQRAEGQWHGGSDIAPARKLDMDNHLIGEEILKLAEDEVSPEDVIFHKFYANKSNLSKGKKKKKKKALEEDEVTDDLLPERSDDSEDEEVENMFGFGQAPEVKDGGFDYDDLDAVALEDDDELLGQSSEEGDSDSAEVQDLDSDSGGDDILNTAGDDDSDADPEVDEWNDEPPKPNKKKRKSEESPFVSVEDYEREKEKYVNGRRKSKSRKRSH